MTRITVILTLMCFILSIHVIPVNAGCISDCKSEYESEIESCPLMFSDPDEDDDLKNCIDDAKSEYESCKEECMS